MGEWVSGEWVSGSVGQWVSGECVGEIYHLRLCSFATLREPITFPLIVWKCAGVRVCKCASIAERAVTVLHMQLCSQIEVAMNSHMERSDIPPKRDSQIPTFHPSCKNKTPSPPLLL